MKHHNQVLSNLKVFSREVFVLVKTPVFISLTILGNAIIGLCGSIFYYLEKDLNPHLKSFVDALWWSFSTATTTGYGDVTPVTTAGKMLGIFLMLIGLALFAMFTGLFAEIILTQSRPRH